MRMVGKNYKSSSNYNCYGSSDNNNNDNHLNGNDENVIMSHGYGEL